MHLCTTVILVTLMASSNIAISSHIWRLAGRMTGILLNKCFWADAGDSLPHPEQAAIILKECLKQQGLKFLDRAISQDVIELFDGVELVKYKQINSTRTDRQLVISRSYKNETDWKFYYIEAIRELFDTHVLNIHLKNLEHVHIEEGRTRRRQNMFSQVLMFGLIAASFIVIPMGFQFLAILGGKALLLAKMALLLTSIQGLKKIATSHMNYGLYSTYGGGHQPWQYDRHWPYEGPEGHQGLNYDGVEGNSDLLHPRNDIVLQE